jgi:hypothetical protein
VFHASAACGSQAPLGLSLRAEVKSGDETLDGIDTVVCGVEIQRDVHR